MIHYTVPTSHGLATRSSSQHSMTGDRYRFVAVQLSKATGTFREFSWHRTRALAQGSGAYGRHPGEIVEIADEHCREPKKRGSA